ncbi:hypothetical protein [Caldivirga sp.]|uniref:hypothetical protein n=1 Tax=Caldivirga sp. TaxID=2080243 RepID=UPI003D115979
MGISMVAAIVVIPPVNDGELLSKVIGYMERSLIKAGLNNVVFCGPLKGARIPGLVALATYVDYNYVSSRGLLKACVEVNVKPPIMLIRGSQPYLSPETYAEALWALSSFNRPIVVLSRGGRGLSTPILVSSSKLVSRLVWLNYRFKLASAMVRFLIEHKRDVLLVEVKDECLGVRLSPSACLSRIND